ncbi:YlbE-like family protein [Alkalihalobacillus pseudalcaliphilus]|uniref:YlbE-like family protein n=1 Tax=Alkalihalobacillus pseudalcaliphilus TaxID=79884 RepID=UPI0030811DD8
MEIQQLLHEKPELRQFMRQNPIWYRKITREPHLIPEMEKESNYFYGKTFPQRVEKVQNNIGLAMMMIEMLKMGKNSLG